MGWDEVFLFVCCFYRGSGNPNHIFFQNKTLKELKMNRRDYKTLR